MRNSVLLHIPQEEFRALSPQLEFVALAQGCQLGREGDRVKTAYFLNEGMASMIIETKDGRSVQVGMAGREEMIGLPLSGGLDDHTYNIVMQLAGNGFRISAEAIKKSLPQLPELQRQLLRRLAIRAVELAQNTACNRLHNVKERLARWLLSTHDRLTSDVIAMTHDFLSKLVGTDRATVTVTLSQLERCGTIRQSRGAIAVVNRAKL
ncbi:MAG TPA: Crp/Fnr family transcriptional regulator [Candidatus Sulfotelmatobacter sp.]|nr:Crp/Fnr family transcriptional regulator [Candidatus Sulfotelmatobacter sp.]